MQSTSAAWKETLGCYDTSDRPNLVPISYVELQYTVCDPDAQSDAVATDNGHFTFADTAQITDRTDKTFDEMASCELNQWGLDGTSVIRPDTVTNDTGFVSSCLSGDDGTFTANPIVTLTFDSTYTTNIPGVSVTWSKTYQEWAIGYIVRVYNGTTLLETLTVTDNTDVLSTIEESLTGYNKIELEVTKWSHPRHRVRIEEIIVGIQVVYDRSDLISLECGQSADMLSLSLPEYYIKFELGNTDGTWNPDNPEGAVQYLIEQQEIVARFGYKIGNSVEWVKGGTLYMAEWDTPSNGITASFTAQSLIDFMGADYTLPTNRTLTLYALATDALTQAELPVASDGGNRWSISSALSSITVTLADSFSHTLAEVLQLCANAACCVLHLNRNGYIVIEPLSTTATDYLIDRFVSYENAEYSLSKALKAVSVNSGLGEFVNGTSGETQTVINELIQADAVADAVAEWVAGVLNKRKTLTGDYRPDPRLDALDVITTTNSYATNSVCITDVTYSYDGSFKGNYEGRVV